jgi:hypothetical protein
VVGMGIMGGLSKLSLSCLMVIDGGRGQPSSSSIILLSHLPRPRFGVPFGFV